MLTRSPCALSGELALAYHVSDEEFEELVAAALDRIPNKFTSIIENCAIVIEHEPEEHASLLGLYEGLPGTHGSNYAWRMPDVITIYQGPLERHSKNAEQLEEEVYVTLVHEIGHYFGLDDQQLHDLDWG